MPHSYTMRGGMKGNALAMLTTSWIILLSSRAPAADNPLIGEWFPVKNAHSGLGSTRRFNTNGTMVVTYGSALHFKFQLETNGLTNTVLMPGPKGPDGPPVRMDFTITNNALTLNERKGRQRQQLRRVKGTSGEGLFGQWTGKHYTGARQRLDFTTNLYCYFSVPFLTETGSYTLDRKILKEQYQTNRSISEWQITNDVITLTSSGGAPEQYRRKGAAFPGEEMAFSDKPDPETQKIETLLTHLANLKDASFIRNDVAYQPKEAAAMMRGKWEMKEGDIETAAEFIEQIMTASSSGPRKPYIIRFKDGQETKCADFLKAELKRIEMAVPTAARLPHSDWKPPAPENVTLSNMEQVWSLSLGTNRLKGSVASDPMKGVIYALPPASKGQMFTTCVQISANGKVEREFYKERNMEVRTARLRDQT